MSYGLIVVFLLCWLLVITLCVRGQTSKDMGPEMTILQGRLRGIYQQTYSGRTISAFIGIPFAKPPVGELRFAPPVEAEGWNGTYQATKSPPICPQLAWGEFDGDEDCLYLNLFAPTLLPTMVYIFGGLFNEGNINARMYNGYNFMDEEEVLLVVPSFRLGPFGFLSTGDEVASGNWGLKDLVLACKWVRDNIESFGGDPNRVTLIGHSSGAAIVHHLTLSPLMDGLVHRYITQSGSALSRWAHTSRDRAQKFAFQLGNFVNCSSNSSTELVNCLRQVDTSTIIGTAKLFQEANDTTYYVWGPSIEPEVEGAFMIDTPQNVVDSGKTRDIPWLNGVVRDEGLMITTCFYRYPEQSERTLANLKTYLPNALTYGNLDPVMRDAYTEEVRAYFFNNMTAEIEVLTTNLTTVMSDSMYKFPAWYGLQSHVATAQSPAYFYTFEHLGTLSYTYDYCGVTEVFGVAHADELVYLFGGESDVFGSLDGLLTSVDREMSRKIISMWTSFAANGVPLTSPDTGTTIWCPYDARDNNVLRIGDGASIDLTIQTTFHNKRLRFWQELNAKYFKTKLEF